MEMNDKTFEKVLDAIHKYNGAVQFAMDTSTVEVLRAQLKKELEQVLSLTK